MKYFITLSLIFTSISLAYAQVQETQSPSLSLCSNEWWRSAEIETMGGNAILLERFCPEDKSPLEVAFETYFSELLFSQNNNSEARNRLYSYLFGVVMRSSYTMNDNLQSEYERYFDLFLHVVKLHIEQVFGTLTSLEMMEALQEALQNGTLEDLGISITR